MRICMVTPSVSRLAGGVFPALRGLSSALHHPPNVEVLVAGLRDRFTDEDRPAWGPLSLNICDIRGPRSWGFACDLLPALRSTGADLTHAHGLWMYSSLANLMYTRGKVPYLISPHGMLDPWALANSGWKKRVALWLYEAAHLKGAGCIHALCEAELRAIRAFGIRSPVCVIPNGVDPTDAAAVGCGGPAWLTDVPAGSRILLYLGRIHPKKGLDALLRAWALVRRQQGSGAADWHLVIVGWNQAGHQGELESLTRELGIGGSVCFAGPQFGTAKQMTYAAADALVLPSLSEGLPMTVLEAWNTGLPVLMTQECNLPEGFDAGAARRIEPDPMNIAEHLADFFAMDDGSRRGMGERGRRLVADHFSWNGIATEINAVYTWLIGGGSPPACVSLS